MGNIEEWNHILLVADESGNLLSPASREALGKGRELADALGSYLWLYCEGEGPPTGGIALGADRVFHKARRNASLADRAGALGEVIRKHRPEIVIAPHSDRMTGILGRLAQRFDTGLLTDCVGLEIDTAERLLVAVKPSYEGKLLSEWIWPKRRPQIALIRQGVFPEPFEDLGREGIVDEI
jgi:electron transfer flavoprotein alpha subunit